jgi:hypothetical protein
LADLGAHRGTVPAEPRTQHPVDDGEPPGPVRLLPHPLDDLVGERAEHVGPVHVDAGQFPGRHPEQRPRAQRAEPQLDARLAAVVRYQGRRGVQAADQGAVAAGGQPRVDMPGDHERVVQREDHGEIRRGAAATPAWRYPEYQATNGRSAGAGTPRTDSSTSSCATAFDLRTIQF